MSDLYNNVLTNKARLNTQTVTGRNNYLTSYNLQVGSSYVAPYYIPSTTITGYYTNVSFLFNK